MTQLRRPRSLIAAVAVLAVTGCVSPQQQIADHEDNLAAAGFQQHPANTPERQAMLNSLPPHHFVRRVNGDTVTYIYADPLVCDCLYVGSQQAYGAYQLHIQQQRLADQQELTATTYANPGWDWGAWGPWGPGYGVGFGFGPGIGF